MKKKLKNEIVVKKIKITKIISIDREFLTKKDTNKLYLF